MSVAGNVQFFNPTVRDPGNDARTISWPAFPIVLLKSMTRDQALALADDPVQGRTCKTSTLNGSFIVTPPVSIPMSSIVPKVRFCIKQKLLRSLRRCREAALRTRYLVIINLLHGRGAYETAEVLGVHNTTVYRVAKRFRRYQEAGLLDGREDNGEEKLDEHYLSVLYRVVRGSPQKPWLATSDLDPRVAHRNAGSENGGPHSCDHDEPGLGAGASPSRATPAHGGMPVVESSQNATFEPDSDAAGSAAPGEVAVFEDEVDIHLNPKIGPD